MRRICESEAASINARLDQLQELIKLLISNDIFVTDESRIRELLKLKEELYGFTLQQDLEKHISLLESRY